VDSETEQYIQHQLSHLDFPCTKIIIAQRISSFRGASRILVMDKGRIVERGTHEELLANKGFYHHIWTLQNNAGMAAMEIEPETALSSETELKQATV
jgi:ATP-binding cassette subfamily B protein